VRSEGEVGKLLGDLKKQYHDARHHCYAFVLGAAADVFRAYDDGEPGHSAGDPILGQIRSRNLTYTLVVVVRYFGGVKLGVGGLVQAYKTAAALALDNSELVKREVTTIVNLTYDYATTADVMRLVDDFNLQIVFQDFGVACQMRAELPLRRQEAFIERIETLMALGKGIAWTLTPPDN